MNTCEQAPSELLGAGLPVLLGLVQGPDHVPGVELGVARDDVAAAHHAVTHLLQAVQNLRKAANVIDVCGRELDASLKPLVVSRDALRAEITYDTLVAHSAMQQG